MSTTLKYPVVRLESLAAGRRNAMVGGPFGSNLVSRDYTEEGVPVIRGTNLGASKYVSEEDFVFVSERKADQLRTNTAMAGDLIFTQRGTLGQVGIIPHGREFSRYIVSQSQMKMSVDATKASADYLYYYFRMPSTVTYIENHAIQAGVPHINLGILKHLEVVLPPLPAQRKIAAILTAYDDLIEVNKRRISLLEKMAEELYREWFVRMRFPGHQNTKFVKGVPEGWRLERFTNLVVMNPRESINKSDSVPYVGMENLSQTSMHFISNETRTGASGSKFRNRDTLLPRITPCLENGKRGFVTCLKNNQVGLGSTEFIVFREKALPAEYVYLLTCNSSFRQHAELSMTGASGRQRVQHDCFDYFFIPTPPESVLEYFVDITRPLFDAISKFATQISVLTRTRDLLLPRLISGKLSVEELDIQFPPSMRDAE